jgi:hypothetical protein
MVLLLPSGEATSLQVSRLAGGGVGGWAEFPWPFRVDANEALAPTTRLMVVVMVLLLLMMMLLLLLLMMMMLLLLLLLMMMMMMMQKTQY